MSRRGRNNRQFGGPSFGDWAFLGASAAMTGYAGTRIYRKSRDAKARRRQWEEEYDPDDVVLDYPGSYYLEEHY